MAALGKFGLNKTKGNWVLVAGISGVLPSRLFYPWKKQRYFEIVSTAHAEN